MKLYYDKNKDKFNVKARARYENNKEHKRKLGRDLRKNNHEYYLKMDKIYRSKNKVNIKNSAKKFQMNNPGKINAETAKHRAKKAQATPNWAELDKIKIVYEKAQWLAKLTGLCYHVDHIIPIAGEKVCGLHVWENLQILEKGLNQSKGNR